MFVRDGGRRVRVRLDANGQSVADDHPDDFVDQRLGSAVLANVDMDLEIELQQRCPFEAANHMLCQFERQPCFAPDLVSQRGRAPLSASRPKVPSAMADVVQDDRADEVDVGVGRRRIRADQELVTFFGMTFHRRDDRAHHLIECHLSLMRILERLIEHAPS